MGSRFNVFFADKFDAGINEMQLSDRDALKARMDRVVKVAIEECVRKAEACWQEEREECLAEGEDIDADEEFEFEGYSGDIASGEPSLLYCSEQFAVTAAEEDLLQQGNDNMQFPYEDAWFEPLRALLKEQCEKFGPSLCVRINGRWAIMGYYSD